MKLASIEACDGNICIFEDDGDINDARELINSLMEKTDKICACFIGNDKDGYKFIAASKTVNMKEMSQRMRDALNSRGGGSEKMIQGSAFATREIIEKFFK